MNSEHKININNNCNTKKIKKNKNYYIKIKTPLIHQRTLFLSL